MPIKGVGMLWPTAENYDRFREVSEGEFYDTIETYHAKVGAKYDELVKRGVPLIKVEFDPDDLAKWASEQGRPVDSETRSTYAAMLVARQHDEGGGTQQRR